MDGNSIFIKKSKKAVLLIHGFTASTQEAERLAMLLAKQGYTVSVPLLAGHNTTEAEFARTHADDYYNSALDAFNKLKHYQSIRSEEHTSELQSH